VKQVILRNAFSVYTMEVDVNQKCLVKNIFFFVPQNRVIWVWVTIHKSEWQ